MVIGEDLKIFLDVILSGVIMWHFKEETEK